MGGEKGDGEEREEKEKEKEKERRWERPERGKNIFFSRQGGAPAPSAAAESATAPTEDSAAGICRPTSGSGRRTHDRRNDEDDNDDDIDIDFGQENPSAAPRPRDNV